MEVVDQRMDFFRRRLDDDGALDLVAIWLHGGQRQYDQDQGDDADGYFFEHAVLQDGFGSRRLA